MAPLPIFVDQHTGRPQQRERGHRDRLTNPERRTAQWSDTMCETRQEEGDDRQEVKWRSMARSRGDKNSRRSEKWDMR